jgi:hypothetical protein
LLGFNIGEAGNLRRLLKELLNRPKNLSFAADEHNPLAVRGERRLAAGNAVPVGEVYRRIAPSLHIHIAEFDDGASGSLLFVLLCVQARVAVVSLPASKVSEHYLILVGERIMGYTN